MSIKRLSGAGLTTPKSNKLWDQTTFQSGMFALATVSLTSTAASVTFSGIPANYTHLQVRMSAQTNRATYGRDAVSLQFNGDGGSSYNSHGVYGDGSTIASEANGVATNITLRNVGTTTTGSAYFGSIIVDVLDYTNIQKNKTVRFFGGVDVNGTVGGAGGTSTFGSGLYFGGTVGNAANVISSITFAPGSGTLFSANSHFALYGIKSA